MTVRGLRVKDEYGLWLRADGVEIPRPVSIIRRMPDHPHPPSTFSAASNAPQDSSTLHAPSAPTFGEAFRFWLKLGFISFGGPTGQIAIMHQELVERRCWISDTRFLHALNYCMLLPGPEAQQLATYIGWLLHRTPGGIVAGGLFVLPAVGILWVLSYVYVAYGTVPAIAAFFYGLKPAVTAIVAAAVLRIGRKVLKNPAMWTLAALAFVGLFFFKLPFPAIVLGAGIVGLIGERVRPDLFVVIRGHGSPSTTGAVIDDHHNSPDHTRATWARSLTVLLVCGGLWWLPIGVCYALLGADHALTREGLFFSKAALVTFGGAYAVLPYVAQQAVEHYQWLSGLQMIDGLGLAETTPGPLIMVVQFVGFLGAYHHPGELPPLLAATLGALLSTWTTFLPCFLWIFLGAPYIEGLRQNDRLSAALSSITAAVVGVVLNLAVWFATHVLFPANAPGESAAYRIDIFAIALAVVAFVGMVRWKWSLIFVILASGLTGELLYVARWWTT